MHPPALIALDLDGTLLDSQKRITPRTLAALEAAAARGIHIVPTTGRFFDGMPECVKALPFVRYAVTCNGAAVFDRVDNVVVAREELALDKALAAIAVFERFDVIYDCYQDNWGWITASMVSKADDYTPNAFYARMMTELRTPVPELKAYLKEKGCDVQKVLSYARDPSVYETMIPILKAEVPHVFVTMSNSKMLEVNAENCHKGRALELLAAHLGFGMDRVMAFGDGLNDLTMVRDSGMGVAMANAVPEVLAAAKIKTLSNDEDGVAAVIEKFLGASSESI
ncbi:MAG: HAD family phosphatase [Kiritimatiellae bacterium]|nr:HAD family phosphatase [Kiritimatiellia bacterium]